MLDAAQLLDFHEANGSSFHPWNLSKELPVNLREWDLWLSFHKLAHSIFLAQLFANENTGGRNKTISRNLMLRSEAQARPEIRQESTSLAQGLKMTLAVGRQRLYAEVPMCKHQCVGHAPGCN